MMKIDVLVFLLLVAMTIITVTECTDAKDVGGGPITSGRNRHETQELRRSRGRDRKIEKHRLGRQSPSGRNKELVPSL